MKRLNAAVLAMLAAMLVGVSCGSSHEFADGYAGSAGAETTTGGDSARAGSASRAGNANAGAAAESTSGGAGGVATMPEPVGGAGGAGSDPECAVTEDCDTCQECSAEGVCVAKMPCVTDVQCTSSDACTDPPGSVGCFTAVCNSENRCQYVVGAPNALCGAAASCVDGIATSAEACDEKGMCKAKVANCAAYACNTETSACYAACSSKAQCAAGHDCIDQKCVVPAAVGEACSSNVQCASGHCGCSNATCTSGVCQPVACATCKFDGNNDGTCEGLIAKNSDDISDSCGSEACDGGGLCFKAKGAVCTADSQCSTAHCGCSTASCATKVCQPSACAGCKFDGNNDGTCEGLIASGSDDVTNSCGGQACDGNGACFIASGVACTSNSQCPSNVCGCNNATCASKACQPSACAACKYDGNSDGVCEGSIASGSDDLTNTCGTQACDGAGACLKATGAVCTADAQCTTAHCGCSNATCSAKACQPNTCASCKFDSNSDGTCESSIASGSDDAANTCAAQACDGAGACFKGTGVACTTVAQCASNICGCDNATCTTKACQPKACASCKYDGNNDGVCEGSIASGSDDVSNSCGAQACDGSGACVKANGAACTADSQCASAHCGCSNATCTAKVCQPASCASCKYDPGSDGVCEASIANGSDDAVNSCGGGACNGAGVCLKDLNAACTADAQCASAHCECNNDVCSSRVCATVACAGCLYAGGGTCTALRAGASDKDACVGKNYCSAGTCIAGKGGLGFACGANTDCYVTCIGGHCAYRAAFNEDCDADDSNDCIGGDCTGLDGCDQINGGNACCE